MSRAPKSQRRKKKGGGGLSADDVDGSDGGQRDAEFLSDDFSIAGASSVCSSAAGFGDDDIFGDADDGDGYGDSAAATDRAEEASALRHAKLLDALSLASTLSSEKRSAKRESGLRVVFKGVTQYAAGAGGKVTLESRWDSVKEACLSSIRGSGGKSGSSTPAEQYAACRVLEASSVVLGDDRDDVVMDLDGPLKRVVNATGRAAKVRSAALRCLAMVHFVCGTDCLEDGMDCEAAMDLCAMVGGESYRGEDVPPILRATALDCWALLSTTLHDARIAAGDENDDGGIGLGQGLRLLPLLASCLDNSDVGLRSAAGECFALVHECRLNLGLDEDMADNTTERKFRRGSWDGSEWEVLMDEVKQRVAELSVESNHYMSKKSKKEQRATFRDFMATLVDDESPEEVVNFRGGSLKLRSWKEIVQLNFVRHCLQGGFQVQLMTNETLHEIFGADGRMLCDANGNNMSQLEKRLIMSKTSEAAKAADKDMTKKRRTRTNVKNHFLTADGDDI